MGFCAGWIRKLGCDRLTSEVTVMEGAGEGL